MVALLPLLSTGVFLPAIWKSCAIKLTFVTTNLTVPAGALFVERLNLSAFPTPALTLTVVVCVWPREASRDDAVIPTTAAATASATMRRRADIKKPPKGRKDRNARHGITGLRAS